jgi:hypothetical protein
MRLQTPRSCHRYFSSESLDFCTKQTSKIAHQFTAASLNIFLMEMNPVSDRKGNCDIAACDGREAHHHQFIELRL